jgi:transglutaminase-like putative cysteine protease
VTSHSRVALNAAIATSLTALGLTPLLAGADWLWPLLGALIVVAASGEACRWGRLPRTVTPTFQLSALAVYLTAVYAHDSAIAGFLPGPGAARQIHGLVDEGLRVIRDDAVPVHLGPGISLVVVAAAGLMALAVDTLAVTLGWAALAGLPLLALYSVPATIAPSGASWFWFLLAALGYISLLLADGRDRVRSWGRSLTAVATASRPTSVAARTPVGDRAGSTEASVRMGRRIGVSALGVALLVPLLAPGLARHGLTDADGGSDTISTIDPEVFLSRTLHLTGNQPLLRVRTDSLTPREDYLRVVALDDFDGSSWQAASRQTVSLPTKLPDPLGLADSVPRATVHTTIAASRDFQSQWLPLPTPTSEVRVTGRWRLEPRGEYVVGDNGQTTAGISYGVNSLALTATAAQLAAAGPAPREVQDYYTRLPSTVPAQVRQLAQDVVGDARSPAEMAQRLQDWFTDATNHFTYDLNPPPVPPGANPLTAFLTTRQGFCQQFAGTMAVMLRALGVPARVVVGFTPGVPQGDGTYLVSTHDSHSWPEVYFSGFGWMRFEPTPTISGGRGSEPPYAGSQSGQSAPITPSLPVPSTSPSSGARQQAGCASPQAGHDPDACRSPGALGPQGSTSPPRPWWRGTGTLVALAVVLLLGLLGAPMLARYLARRKRLAVIANDGPRATRGRSLAGLRGWLTGRRGRAGRAAGDASRAPYPGDQKVSDGESAVRRRVPRGSGDAADAAWAELRDDVLDLGYPWDASETPRQTRDRLADAAVMDARSRAALHRLVAAVELARYSATPSVAGDLVADLRHVRTALARPVSRLTRTRARLLPRSARRALVSGGGRVVDQVVWVRTRLRALARLLPAGAGRRLPTGAGERHGYESF